MERFGFVTGGAFLLAMTGLGLALACTGLPLKSVTGLRGCLSFFRFSFTFGRTGGRGCAGCLAGLAAGVTLALTRIGFDQAWMVRRKVRVPSEICPRPIQSIVSRQNFSGPKPSRQSVSRPSTY